MLAIALAPTGLQGRALRLIHLGRSQALREVSDRAKALQNRVRALDSLRFFHLRKPIRVVTFVVHSYNVEATHRIPGDGKRAREIVVGEAVAYALLRADVNQEKEEGHKHDASHFSEGGDDGIWGNRIALPFSSDT